MAGQKTESIKNSVHGTKEPKGPTNDEGRTDTNKEE